ncbi:hypothetical protein Tco_0846568 [Tanacetum coccineum]
MSDSEDSTVTYTAVSSPFEDGSDIGSPGVDGPPIMPEDPYAYIMAAYQVPPSPDYIPGPEEPQSPPPLDFVPEPMYPEYIPQEDEILPAEEQPLPAAASPTVDSPGYVLESDPEEEPEEDDEDPEEDPADYPADRDDDDDDDDDEDEDEEEEEHPALADSVPPVHRMTARISIRDEPSISLPPREEVERLLALTTPPPSPLTPLSSPLPHIPSPPFPASPPASPIRPLGYRAAMIRLRAETPSTSHPLPLPTSSPPLQLLSSDHRTDRPEITLPPRKRLGIDLGPRYEIGESSAAAATRPIGGRRADYGFVGTMDTEIRRQRAEEVGYGIRDVWVDPREAVEEVAPMTLEGVNARVTELTAVQEQDTQDIYAVIEDTQDRQTQIYQSVETGHCLMIVRRSRRSQVVTSGGYYSADTRGSQLTKALKSCCKGYRPDVEFQGQADRKKRSRHSLHAPGQAGSSSRYGYVIAMLCSCISYLVQITNVRVYPIVWLRKRVPEWPVQVVVKHYRLPKMPQTLELKGIRDAIEFATELMDKKINTWAERQAGNKRKSDDTARNNQNQQPNKRQTWKRVCARKIWAFQEGLSKIEEQQQPGIGLGEMPGSDKEEAAKGLPYRVSIVRNEEASGSNSELRTQASKDQVPHPKEAPFCCKGRKMDHFGCASIIGN